MNITQFNRPNCKEVRVALEAAVKSVEAQFGITIDLGSGSFSEDRYSVKVTAMTKSRVANVMAIGSPAGTVGMGTQFKIRTCNFTVIAVKPSRPKYKFVAQNQNGTRYKFSLSDIQSYIARG